MEMALRKKSATMHGIAAPGEANPTTVQLGPAVYSEVEFEGCHVKALVDTGSPATIVSLDCVLSALAKGRPKSQTPSEWERVVKQTLKPPEVTLRSNEGGGLDIIAQLSATIQSGQYRKTALLQAVCLPAHYACIVRARVDPPACEATPMFKPTKASLNQWGWEAEEGIVGANDDHTTTLVLQNPGDVTVHLCEGDILGELQQVCEVSEGEGVKEMSDPVVGQVLVEGEITKCE